jgi:nickel-dependent lactate racemase
MASQKYRIPYGKSHLEFELPSTMSAHLVESRHVPPLEEPEKAIDIALAHPLGTAPLRALARPGDRVCIVFTDITRATPDHLLVPALLRELEIAGVRDEDITLLCGIGMHRPSTQGEKVQKLGSEVVHRYQVIDNDPQNLQALLDLGFTAAGVPLLVNRVAAQADLLIATGIVEPHQYAGYSGGRKTVAIGAAGEASIAHTHGPAFVDHPGTRLGCLEGNLFHETVTEAALRAGLRFILNVVLDDDQRLLRVAAGDPQQAFQDLVDYARSVYEVPVPHPYDIAIGGVGYPKDVNLYQASRAPSYLHFAPTPVVRPGGFYLIPARCQEGAGEGVGEQRFLTAMRDAPDVQHILDEARRNSYPPGGQRAFVLAKVLESTQIVIVGSACPELVAACKMIPAATMAGALELAGKTLGNACEVLIVPHALLTLPIITPAFNAS